MRNRWVAAGLVLVSAVLGACNGWPRAPEHEEAQHKPEVYPTYTATPAEEVQVFSFGNRRWLISPASVALRGVNLVPVGTAAQTTIYAEATQRTSFSALYAPAAGGKWRRVLSIE